MANRSPFLTPILAKALASRQLLSFHSLKVIFLNLSPAAGLSGYCLAIILRTVPAVIHLLTVMEWSPFLNQICEFFSYYYPQRSIFVKLKFLASEMA
jgi:hypothetical protein